MKSIIVWLKLLEAEFIELRTGNTPLLLIDDFMSELDDAHRELLLESFSKYQTIITNIEKNSRWFSLPNRNVNILCSCYLQAILTKSKYIILGKKKV